MRIEIKSTELKNKQGIGKTSGKPYNFFEQKAYAHVPNQHYPIQISVTVESGSSAYPPGNYQLADESFYVNKFGNLDISPKLKAEAK